MDPNGFRMFMASAGYVSGLPNIGDSYKGGYYAGLISHTADGVATHALIVAPKATGASGTGYTLTTNYKWKTSNTTTSGTTSTYDGRANTDAMITAGITSHPAAKFCVDLTIGGYSDWYLPSRYELDIAYYNLKPTTTSNNTSTGINNYSVAKRTSNYTTSDPAQTSVSAFQSGGAQAFVDNWHWSSTEASAAFAYQLNFSTGYQYDSHIGKDETERVRAFRREAL